MQHHLARLQDKKRQKNQPTGVQQQGRILAVSEANEAWVECVAAFCETPARFACCCCVDAADRKWKACTQSTAWVVACCPCILCARMICDNSGNQVDYETSEVRRSRNRKSQPQSGAPPSAVGMSR